MARMTRAGGDAGMPHYLAPIDSGAHAGASGPANVRRNQEWSEWNG
jgi:hypothetical protein